MSKPSWNDAPEWAQWLAQDKNGCWFWYERKPTVSTFKQQWVINKPRRVEVAGKGACETEWQNTLEQRPDKVTKPVRIKIANRLGGVTTDMLEEGMKTIASTMKQPYEKLAEGFANVNFERNPDVAAQPRFNKSGSKYLRAVTCDINGFIDVYAVLDAFNVTCPARQHAIKKLLCSGIRGKGDVLQDLREAGDAITRAIQMQESRDSFDYGEDDANI